MEEQKNSVKKQVLIFLGVAFVLPYALGILMGYAYSKGIDVSVFPSAQMFYPAAGAMLSAMITRKGDSLLPKRFFVGFLMATLMMLLCAVASIFAPNLPWNMISQLVMIASSIILLVLLLTEKKDKRIAYGLKGNYWKASFLIILLYLLLYFLRAIFAYVIGGEAKIIVEIAQNSLTWISLAALPINYFLVLSAFLGEEYGWRYYLQPILQKKFGMVPGIFVLGIVWGLWHLPINVFYYTSPSVGLISVAGQLITCITLGVFYGWAYMKTDNIWTVVILHFVNNNLVPIVSGNYSADVLQNQEVTWGSVLFSLIVNVILFMGVIFTSYYKDYARRLPTMNERADQYRQSIMETMDSGEIN